MGFDATTTEQAQWSSVAPQGLTTPLTAVVFWAAATATSGTYAPRVKLEAITSGDAVDTDATSSFDTVNTVSAVTVPGTAGYMTATSITLTNNASIAAGDYFRLALDRDGIRSSGGGDGGGSRNAASQASSRSSST